MSEPLDIEVGWPADPLWPNKSAHYMVVGRFRKSAKNEAGWATRYVLTPEWAPEGEKVKVHIIGHAKPTGPFPDADNTVAAVKSHLDGIADALGINDREFEAPTVEWVGRNQRGSLTIRVS